MKKIIITGSLFSIFLLSFAASAQSGLEECLANNKESEHGETACYSQFIKQAQQKGKDKFETDLQKNTADLQAATKKANEEQRKQLQHSGGTAQQPGNSASTPTPTTTKVYVPPTTKTPSPSKQQLKIEDEEETTRSIPYY